MMAKKNENVKKAEAEERFMVDNHDLGDVASQQGAADREWFMVGKTINIGNYESIRVEVGRGFSVPSPATRLAVRKQLVREVLADAEKMLDYCTKLFKNS